MVPFSRLRIFQAFSSCWLSRHQIIVVTLYLFPRAPLWGIAWVWVRVRKISPEKNFLKICCNAAVSNLFSCVSACFCEAGFLFRLDNKWLKQRCFWTLHVSPCWGLFPSKMPLHYWIFSGWYGVIHSNYRDDCPLIITITKLSNLIGYQLPWFQP